MSEVSRRRFLLGSAAAGGALTLGFVIAPGCARSQARATAADLNAFVRIHRDDAITLMIPCSEMGQGIHTGLAQVLADELEADWNNIKVEVPQPAEVYNNPAFHVMMLTVGSTSMRHYYAPLRTAGAAAREMLVAAAAQRWGVRAADCHARDSQVIGPGDARERYGALAAEAASLPVPQTPALKKRSQWRLIGQPVQRLDVPAKVDGSAVFGTDVSLPGLLHAAIAQCPVFGGTLQALGGEETVRAMPGVRAIVRLEPNAAAVVADRYWQAQRALDALQVRWNERANVHLSSAGIASAFRAALERKEEIGIAEDRGEPERMLAGAARAITADYEAPFLAHATLEPLNCTVRVGRDECEVWVPTQGQTIAQGAVAEVTGMAPERVRLHTTLLGGGFGRKAQADFVVQAARIASSPQLRGSPVRLLWSRVEDMQHDYYRPAALHRHRAVLGEDGLPLAWTQRIVSPSIALSATPLELENHVDPMVTEGATGLAYSIPHRRVEYARSDFGVPVGFWRSVGWSVNTFTIECFLDELAAAAGRDSYEFRRALLADNPRHRAVLELLAERTGWGKPAPDSRHRGLAMCEADGTVVAEAVELSVPRSGELHVHRIVCAADCGTVVNPDRVREQLEGAALFGLSAALHEEITIEDGRVAQRNFRDYPLLRLHEAPAVEVHLIASEAPPSGVGEAATAPVAAAVCSALYAATGQRIRSLPLRKHGFASAARGA